VKRRRVGRSEGVLAYARHRAALKRPGRRKFPPRKVRAAKVRGVRTHMVPIAYTATNYVAIFCSLNHLKG
jgi:hypothetical protein